MIQFNNCNCVFFLALLVSTKWRFLIKLEVWSVKISCLHWIWFSPYSGFQIIYTDIGLDPKLGFKKKLSSQTVFFSLSLISWNSYLHIQLLYLFWIIPNKSNWNFVFASPRKKTTLIFVDCNYNCFLVNFVKDSQTDLQDSRGVHQSFLQVDHRPYRDSSSE